MLYLYKKNIIFFIDNYITIFYTIVTRYSFLKNWYMNGGFDMEQKQEKFSTIGYIAAAVFGASFISPFNASVVFPFDLASSIFPTVISARIIAADSK